MTDPFYKSDLWKQLRAAVIRRSRGICEVAGCGARGVVVDHIVARRAGGADAIGNLRHLCRRHDNEIKERPDGTRPNGGSFKPIAACGADGLPLDQAHPFFGQGGSIIPTSTGTEPRGSRLSSKFRRGG